MLKKFRNQILCCLLPAVLLFAQQTAMAHLAAHAAGESQGPEKSLAHQKLCDKCLFAEKLTNVAVETAHRIGPDQNDYIHFSAVPPQLHSINAVRESCRDPPKPV